MERLNWAVLGLIGIVTALGLGTSSGAGKSKTGEQPVSVAASSNAPGCSACRIAQAEAATKIAATPIKTDDACPGNYAATGVCCEQSANKKESVVTIERSSDEFEFKIPGNTKAWVIDGTGICKPVSGEVASTDCPLTKVADAIANLTKHYVCEGGECLTKPGQGTLTITAVDPASEKPEGLLNLLAAAEVTATAQSDQGPVSSTITISGEDLTKAGAGTLTLSVKAADDKPAVAIVTETKAADAKPAIDNSRAAVRAAKLAKLEEKMAQPWTLAFNETPLTQAVAAVQEKYGVPVLLDRKALDEGGIDLATPLTADQQPEIEAGEFLRGCLRNHSLTWMIPASNDHVLITTYTAEDSTLINRVYDVSDLADAVTGSETIVERIQMLIEPTTWRASGGMGDLGLMQNGDKVRLIAMNRYWVHRQIATLLEELRMNNPKQPVAPLEVETGAVLRRHQLPGVGATDDIEVKRKLLVAQKRLLLNLLKQNPGFDAEVFEIVDFDNQPVLHTKQLPAVHRQIAELIHSLNPNKGPVGGFSASCDYGDFDPGAAASAKLPGNP